MNVNITKPDEFFSKFTDLMKTLYNIFELTRENTLSPVVNGVRVYDEETGKTGFQVSGQFNRPNDFLVALLDVIRITFEPMPLGSLLLNANYELFLNAIPDKPFRLGYITAISQPNEPIGDFFTRSIEPRLIENNYMFESAFARFIMVSVNEFRYYKTNILGEIMNFFESGFSVDEVVGMLKATVNDEPTSSSASTHCGFSIDNSLRDEMRLSMWLFLPQTPLRMIQCGAIVD